MVLDFPDGAPVVLVSAAVFVAVFAVVSRVPSVAVERYTQRTAARNVATIPEMIKTFARVLDCLSGTVGVLTCGAVQSGPDGARLSATRVFTWTSCELNGDPG